MPIAKKNEASRDEIAMTTMMKCGHAANAETAEGAPLCVICVGINPGAREIVSDPPDLSGRTVKCTDCGKTRPSTEAIAFFKHNPDSLYDSHYDGCYGWD